MLSKASGFCRTVKISLSTSQPLEVEYKVEPSEKNHGHLITWHLECLMSKLSK